VFQGYELLYAECGIASLINSLDLWTSVTGLETIANNSWKHLGYFMDTYEALKVCDSNYNTCGYQVGKLYSQMTGWTVMPTTTLKSSFFDADDIPVFMNGLVEGIASP